MTSVVGMIDPPREESKAAVADALRANIQVRMVTGDDVVTGAAIAKQLGIPGEAILGADFAALSEEEQLRRIDTIGVVGRVAPEHKVLIVKTLQKKNNVVAMTGDGVNDAPAIKSADIGIAMGTGTEVAKNAGRMILTDDNFATIVRAVHVGRALYDDLLKYIRFMLVVLVAYVVTFLVASVLNIAAGQPFSAVQILWINFAVTAPIGVTLGMDKEAPGLMLRRPRPRDTRDHDDAGHDHGRPRRAVHRRLPQCAHRLGEEPVRQLHHRLHHGAHRVRPLPLRHRLSVAQPDRDDPPVGDVRQPDAQPRDPR